MAFFIYFSILLRIIINFILKFTFEYFSSNILNIYLYNDIFSQKTEDFAYSYNSLYSDNSDSEINSDSEMNSDSDSESEKVYPPNEAIKDIHSCNQALDRISKGATPSNNKILKSLLETFQDDPRFKKEFQESNSAKDFLDKVRKKAADAYIGPHPDTLADPNDWWDPFTPSRKKFDHTEWVARKKRFYHMGYNKFWWDLEPIKKPPNTGESLTNPVVPSTDTTASSSKTTTDLSANTTNLSKDLKKEDKQSPIDYVIEKESLEMPDIPSSDGGD